VLGGLAETIERRPICRSEATATVMIMGPTRIDQRRRRRKPQMLALKRLTADKAGVTAIEYALIASFVGIAAAVVIGSIGTALSGIFNTISTSL
jgi:Flp pilus assembly pilin Flp